MYRFIISLILLVLLAACGTPAPAQPTLIPTVDATATVELPTPTPASLVEAVVPQQANIRIIHAAPQTTSVNVLLGDFSVASQLSFGVTTDRTAVPAGDYTLRVMSSDPAADDDPLYETDLDIAGGASLILIFTGTSDARTLATYDESNEPLDANQSRVTAIHAVPRGVDFTLRQTDVDLTSAVTFGQASTPAILPSGRTDLQFQAGTDTLLTYPIELREGFNHTLVLVGSSNDPNSLAVIAFDNIVPGRSSVRALHAAIDVSLVDFYLDGELISSNLDYARVGERVPTIAGTRIAAIYEAGADPAATQPLFSQSIELPANTTLSLILLGSQTRLRFLPFIEDLSPTEEGQIRLSFVNTLEDVPVARVENINGTLADVYYAQQPDDVTFTAGTYTLFWNTISTGESLEIGSELEFEAGRAYLYLFTGRDLSDPPLIFSENVGTLGDTVSSTDTQARFVNAIPDTTLDFVIDGSVVASGIAFGQSSELTAVPENTHVVTVRSAASSADLVSADYEFTPSTQHTVFAYGEALDVKYIRGLPDSFAQESGSASVRLINLSADSVVEFGLANSNITTQPSSAPVITTELAIDQTPTFRQSLPLDTLITLRGVRNQSSEFVADTTAIPLGMRDLYVIDSATQQVAAYINALSLEADMHYDVVAFQSSSTLLVRAFVVSYPIIDQ